MELTSFKFNGRDVSFTRQQLKILKLASDGHSNKEIGDLLCIEVTTVKRHRQDIMGKLEIKGKTAMMKFLMMFKAKYNQ
jgi:DNA-binding NarL/FixJ family response regulator